MEKAQLTKAMDRLEKNQPVKTPEKKSTTRPKPAPRALKPPKNIYEHIERM